MYFASLAAPSQARDLAGHLPNGPQRQTADAHVMPAPKPDNKIKSPSDTRPAGSASTSAMGMDAELVLPVRSSTMADFSVGMPSRAHTASMIRPLA